MFWFNRIFLSFVTLSLHIQPVFTTVTETTQDYTCNQEFHTVECEYAFNHSDCDQFWSAQEHSIGTFVNFIPECHSPCKELFVGKIVLDDCVNVTLAVICTREYLTEYRVHFNGVMIPQSLHNPVERGHLGVFPSVALLAIVCVLCAGIAYKNYAQDNH